MKLFGWLTGRKYLEWDEYVKKVEDIENKYWEDHAQKRKLQMSK